VSEPRLGVNGPGRDVSPPRLVVAGITFDFGNTLVQVDRPSLRAVVGRTAAALVERGSIRDPATFLAGWVVERDRQFRIQVPQLLEVDLGERVRHVLAGLRGAAVPSTDEAPWDEGVVARLVDDAEVEFAVETYSDAFVAAVAPLPEADATIRGAHERGFRLGILSNWPLARTIDRYVERQGWADLLSAVVVSQRIGVIKPHPAIFAAASEALDLPAGELLHLGDDWAADVVGGGSAGFRVGYLRGHQGDTPLPTSLRDEAVTPDLELDSLAELAGLIQCGRVPNEGCRDLAGGAPATP
jgi:FMN phosphatase YigB (HAD superfamily)